MSFSAAGGLTYVFLIIFEQKLSCMAQRNKVKSGSPFTDVRMNGGNSFNGICCSPALSFEYYFSLELCVTDILYL